MALDYDLNEYSAVMDLHSAACEAWEAYADTRRRSMTTVRAKNETHAALASKVGEMLRELQRLRDSTEVDMSASARRKIVEMHKENERLTEALKLASAAIVTLQGYAKQAETVLREVAADLRDCHTIGGEWDGTETEAQAEYDKLVQLADRLAPLMIVTPNDQAKPTP